MEGKIRFSFLLFLIIISIGIVSAEFGGGVSSGYNQGYQYYQPNFNRIYSGSDISNFWPILRNIDKDQCTAVTDFVIGIPPGGCSPMVVRSDLLAEQNVPVFCQLQAVKVNPLIKVSSIQSISFKGEYPEGVSGISYHPARAASRSYRTLLGDPIINNIGYVVIILKRNQVEGDLAEWIAGNLTATIRYDLEEAYGAGRSEYYLHFEKEGDEGAFARASFWRGSGFLNLKSVNRDSATVEVLNGRGNVLRTITLREGQTGDVIYMPSYYCKAGLKIKLNRVVSLEDSALLNIDGQELWVRAGTRLLNGKCSVRSLDVDGSNKGSVKISCPGDSFTLYLDEKENSEDLEDKDYSDEIESNFLKGVEAVKILVDDYGLEKKDVGEITYAEEALYEQIKLAEDLGKQKVRAELLDLFIESFPLSRMIDHVRFERQLLNDTNFSQSVKSVYVTNKFHTIGLRQLKKETDDSKKVKIKIGGIVYEKSEGGNVSFDDVKYTIERIEPGKVRVSYSKKNSRAKSGWFIEGEWGSLGGKEIYVADIDVLAVAHLSVIPEIKQTKTEANFTFKIGIEKRAIELSPEKAEKLMDNIDDSLEKWKSINGKLGTTIKAWKGACFATSTYLMLKNVASGFSGEALARKKVMERYKVICDTEHSEMSHDACYRKLSKEIDGNVSEMADALKSVNDFLDEKIESGDYAIKGGILSEGKINNNTKYLEDLKKEIGDWNRTVDGQLIEVKDLNTVEQVRAVLLAQKLEGSEGVAGAVAQAELDISLRNVAWTAREREYRENNQKDFGFESDGDELVFPITVLREGQKGFLDEGLRVTGRKLQSFVNGNLSLEDNKEYGAQIVHAGSDDYLYVFDTNGAQRGVWGVEGGRDKLKLGEKKGGLPEVSGAQVVMVAKGSCSNSWDPDDAEVRFYESGRSKGLPAIVPFDLRNGWYAKVSNSEGTAVENSPKGYQESGAVEYFAICNIGPNAIMENGAGDDLCQTFSIHSAGSVEDFGPCRTMDKGEVKRLYNRALDAIRQASRQYGQHKFTIFEQEFGLGSPYSATGELECQDFMSPGDCNLMFNVCDPVICPSSRCDLGGKMPVADVVQTGIIGGILMCLPNAKDGIKVPLCLSGIHAGLESYISILESERACLQESVDSGRLVGICDEVTSIYKCEFFWKQASPVIKFVVPRAIESFVSGGSRTRGGGEYLLVQEAWDNLETSLDYFKSTYAPNAFRAFNLRNVEEAGSEFCKAFVGTSFPTSAEAIDSLLEPESPPQFNAYFSESLFSEATLPATSHYKVYYHIFAGNERGVNYRVYLRDPPKTSYYSSSPRLYVKSGYISVGESADESIDFTAPQGYKELCVTIDDREWCGFKAVSSGVAVELVSDAYSEEQASKSDISSEKECISGTPSAIPLANMNLQAGAEEAVDPEIALRGIVRVCATQSPSEGDRWRDVGYCGDVNLRCYLDTESVREDIERLEAFGEGLSIESLEDKSKEFLAGSVKTYEEIRSILSGVRESIRKGEVSEEIVDSLDKITLSGSGALNNYKAEAWALKASIYRLRVVEGRKDSVENQGPEAGPRSNGDGGDNGESSSEGDSEEGGNSEEEGNDANSGESDVGDNNPISRQGVYIKEDGNKLKIFKDGDYTQFYIKEKNLNYTIWIERFLLWGVFDAKRGIINSDGDFIFYPNIKRESQDGQRFERELRKDYRFNFYTKEIELKVENVESEEDAEVESVHLDSLEKFDVLRSIPGGDYYVVDTIEFKGNKVEINNFYHYDFELDRWIYEEINGNRNDSLESQGYFLVSRQGDGSQCQNILENKFTSNQLSDACSDSSPVEISFGDQSSREEDSSLDEGYKGGSGEGKIFLVGSEPRWDIYKGGNLTGLYIKKNEENIYFLVKEDGGIGHHLGQLVFRKDRRRSFDLGLLPDGESREIRNLVEELSNYYLFDSNSENLVPFDKKSEEEALLKRFKTVCGDNKLLRLVGPEEEILAVDDIETKIYFKDGKIKEEVPWSIDITMGHYDEYDGRITPIYDFLEVFATEIGINESCVRELFFKSPIPDIDELKDGIHVMDFIKDF